MSPPPEHLIPSRKLRSFSEFSVGFDTKTKTLEFLNHILYKFNFIWSEKSENLEQNEWNQFELDIEKLFKENEDYDFSIQQKKEIMTKINQLISIWSIRCDEKDKKLKLIIVWCNSDEKYFDREKGIDFIWVENVYSDIILNMVIDISTFDWVLQPYQNLNALSIELKEDPQELSNKFFAYVTFPYHKKTLYTIESIKLYGEYYDRQGKQNYDSFFEYSKWLHINFHVGNYKIFFFIRLFVYKLCNYFEYSKYKKEKRTKLIWFFFL